MWIQLVILIFFLNIYTIPIHWNYMIYEGWIFYFLESEYDFYKIDKIRSKRQIYL
jgi:hypothetical protein